MSQVLCRTLLFLSLPGYSPTSTLWKSTTTFLFLCFSSLTRLTQMFKKLNFSIVSSFLSTQTPLPFHLYQIFLPPHFLSLKVLSFLLQTFIKLWHLWIPLNQWVQMASILWSLSPVLALSLILFFICSIVLFNHLPSLKNGNCTAFLPYSSRVTNLLCLTTDLFLFCALFPKFLSRIIYDKIIDFISPKLSLSLSLVFYVVNLPASNCYPS